MTDLDKMDELWNVNDIWEFTNLHEFFLYKINTLTKVFDTKLRILPKNLTVFTNLNSVNTLLRVYFGLQI